MARNLNPQQRAQLERRAWELRCRGYTQVRILEALAEEGIQVTDSAVSRALKRVNAQLRREFVGHAEEVKLAQSGRLEHLYSEAMAAWERSCQDGVTETVTIGRSHVTKEGEVINLPDQTVRSVRGQAGDPRFLEQARSALAAIREIFGLDAPKKQDVTSNGETVQILGYEVVRPPDADRASPEDAAADDPAEPAPGPMEGLAER